MNVVNSQDPMLGNPLPPGWTTAFLRDVGDIRYGLGQPPEQAADGIPLVRATNVKRGRIVRDGLIRIKHEAIPKSRNPYLRQGDIIVVRSGAYTGDAAMVTKDWVGSVLGYDLVFSPRQGLDPAYCAAVLLSDPVQSYFLGQRDRSAQPHLNRQQLQDAAIPLPPLQEQQKIAALLGLVQQAIEQQERLIVLTAELKNALMNKLFTKGLHAEHRKETEFGPVPENWQVVPLRDCCIVQTGIAKGRRVEPEEALTLPYLRVANVQDGFLELSQIKKITIRAKEKDRYLLRKGDVVLTEGGDFDKLGRGFIWQGQIENCVHQNHIFSVRVDTSRLKPEFFAHLSQSPYGKSFFLSVAHKTTNLACINTTKLKRFPVLIPTMAEQETIVSALDSVDARLIHHTRKKTVLEELFRTLLHQLMTAQIRVHDLDLNNLDLNSSDQREEVIATTGR